MTIREEHFFMEMPWLYEALEELEYVVNQISNRAVRRA